MSDDIRFLLEQVKNGQVDVDAALLKLKMKPIEDLGYANVDLHRQLRQGVPEVIYGAGKTSEQIVGIISSMQSNGQGHILITRLAPDVAAEVQEHHSLTYIKDAYIGYVGDMPTKKTDSSIAIVTGGTSDYKVAEECAITAEFYGNTVNRIYDVGVAGIHRLLQHLDTIIDVYKRQPPGRIQIEVGVQSTHKKTLDAINRYNDWPYIQKSIRPIIQAGRTHVHMDLIVGLPHEDFNRFGQSFNDLFSLQPHALQIGFLKLLKGSGVRRMNEYKYVADPLAPYEVLSTHVLPYDDVRFLKYFEDVFERFYNSERFRTTFGYIGQQLIHGETDAFTYFCDMTRAWLKEGNHKVNLKDIDQIEFLYRFFLAKGDTIAAELLQYDTLVSYRGKVRSEAVGLPKQTKELLQVGEAFWRNEEIASTFIPNYTFKEWRKIRQQYVEMTMSRETAIYLGIQHIPEGDFTVIIDVNKEVTPFIRPENIQ